MVSGMCCRERGIGPLGLREPLGRVLEDVVFRPGSVLLGCATGADAEGAAESTFEVGMGVGRGRVVSGMSEVCCGRGSGEGLETHPPIVVRVAEPNGVEVVVTKS